MFSINTLELNIFPVFKEFCIQHNHLFSINFPQDSLLKNLIVKFITLNTHLKPIFLKRSRYLATYLTLLNTFIELLKHNQSTEYIKLALCKISAKNYHLLTEIFFIENKIRLTVPKNTYQFFINIILKPMFFEQIKKSHRRVYSSYIGPISTLHATPNVDDAALDLFLKNKIQGNDSLRTYLTALKYLNYNFSAHQHFLPHLAEIENIDKLLFLLIMIPEDILIRLSGQREISEVYGLCQTDYQAISVRINKSYLKISQTILHELQHLYNMCYFDQKQYQVECFTFRDFNILKLLLNKLNFPKKKYQKIYLKILKIFNNLLINYAAEHRSLNEMSAFLSELLLTFKAEDIRLTLNFLKYASLSLSHIKQTIENIDAAFQCIEHALINFSKALSTSNFVTAKYEYSSPLESFSNSALKTNRFRKVSTFFSKDKKMQTEHVPNLQPKCSIL